jgi:PAS domain S-box-containing protein
MYNTNSNYYQQKRWGVEMKLQNQYVLVEKQSRAIDIVRMLIEKNQNENNAVMTAELDKVMDSLHALRNLKILADYLYDGIHIVDPDGYVVYINDAFTRITGFTSDIVGKHIGDLAGQGYIADIALEALKTNKTVKVVKEHSLVKVIVATTASPVFGDDGDKLGVIIIDRDITEIMDLKEQLDKSKMYLQVFSEEQAKRENGFLDLIKKTTKTSMIGTSKEAEVIRNLIYRIAPLDATVLITGETGTGKEVVGNEIYMHSLRYEKPFIKVNCAAIPANLMESEFFGYEKGAFTGASTTGKAGFFELSNGGTILLDEIGDMPLELQSKLLRVIQQKEVTRIGGTKAIKLDVRVIASTNCNLFELVEKGKFRMDLYYRLNVFPINVPPLRDRKGDIRVLAEHFLSIFNDKYNKTVVIEESVYELLANYQWVGNIRELQNIIERVVLISNEKNLIDREIIIPMLGVANPKKSSKESMSLKERVEEFEKEELLKALEIGKTTRKVAQMLKIDQSNVVRKAKKYGISLIDVELHHD